MKTIVTHSQEEFDVLVQAGMDYTQEPSDGVGGQGKVSESTGCEMIPFRVTDEIAEKYKALQLAIAQADSEQNHAENQLEGGE